MAAKDFGSHYAQVTDWWKAFCNDFISEHNFDVSYSAEPFAVDIPVPYWVARMGAERMEFRPVEQENGFVPVIVLYEPKDASSGKQSPMAVILPPDSEIKDKNVFGARVLTGEVRDAVLDVVMLQADALSSRMEANLKDFLERHQGADGVAKVLETTIVQDVALDDRVESRASLYHCSRFLEPPVLMKVKAGALARLHAIQRDIESKLSERQKRERKEMERRNGEPDIEGDLDSALDRKAGRMDFRFANLSDYRSTVSVKEVADVCDWALTPPAKRRPGCRYETFEPMVVKKWAQNVCKEFGLKTEKLPARLQMQNAAQKAKLVKQVK